MEQKVREEARRRRRPLREAASSLELAIGAPAGTGSAWHERVRTQILEVSAALDDHVQEVERPGGLVEQISFEAPRVINMLNRMRAEHTDMYEAIARALEAVGGEPRGLDPERAATVREAVMTLLGWVARHRQKGADLLYEAYNVDIGGE